jgi:hypothetical protein
MRRFGCDDRNQSFAHPDYTVTGGLRAFEGRGRLKRPLANVMQRFQLEHVLRAAAAAKPCSANFHKPC